MGESSEAGSRKWALRTAPDEVAQRYLAEGWWNHDTLGMTVAAGLAGRGRAHFQVHSSVRPWTGTFHDVDRAARLLAASLRAKGIGPGSVVVIQLPNWVEAAISFWAAAYLGATVIPVIHFYGAKEVDYIIGATSPDVIVTADHFGHSDYVTTYAELLEHRPGPLWLVAAGPHTTALPKRAIPFASMVEGAPLEEPATVDPDAPAVVGFTSGTTSNPKGVVHSHRTIGCEARQLDYLFPKGGPPTIIGAPVGHFIGMLNAFLMPLLRDLPVHLLDVWDPAEVLRLMDDEGIGVGGGATYFLTSLLDHPNFTPDHLAHMPFAGLGGSPVPVAVMERATALGISVFRSYGSTEHPSITGCLLEEAPEKRLATDGRALPGVEFHLDAEGQILSRGPDCFVGYTDAALTAKVFDHDGWYLTGDVGTVDEDGYLTITDRISDIIIRGGENISAQEIEEVMATMASVAEVCVVAEPDDRLGEHAAAVLRVHRDMAPPTLDDVRRHMSWAGLARQKWPEAILAVDEFPRTPSGKVQKFRLRQELKDGTLQARQP